MKSSFRSSRDIIIQNNDLEGAVRFYHSVLELPVSHRSDTLVGFETGSFCLYVEKGTSPLPVFEFYVTDLETTKRDLIAAGCTVEEEDPEIPRLYVRDPCGLVFNIAESR